MYLFIHLNLKVFVVFSLPLKADSQVSWVPSEMGIDYSTLWHVSLPLSRF